jgi:hypothetical protein
MYKCLFNVRAINGIMIFSKMDEGTEIAKGGQALWGEIDDNRLQSMVTRNSIKPTQAAQNLISIPSCNKLLLLEKPLVGIREFAWRSVMDKNVVESVNLMSNYLSTSDLHESRAEPAFIIADFNDDVFLGSTSKASKEWYNISVCMHYSSKHIFLYPGAIAK